MKEESKCAAVMPCGAVVTNVYDAYEAGKKSALAKQEQSTECVGEPVAWEGFTNFANPLGTRLIFTTKFEADEWLKDFVEGHAWLKPLSYTTPQQRKPLTDEFEIEQALSQLIDKICPELDTGNILEDAKTASQEIDLLKSNQEQGEPVAIPDCGEAGHDDGCCGNAQCLPSARRTTPQQRKPLMLEKFLEMEALLDDRHHQHKKMFTDDELKIIMETTMPVIDWKARYGVELNNGERNKWMLEWFIAFARAIEAAHGIKE